MCPPFSKIPPSSSPPTATYCNTEMLEMRLLSIQYVTLKDVKGPGDFHITSNLKLGVFRKGFRQGTDSFRVDAILRHRDTHQRSNSLKSQNDVGHELARVNYHFYTCTHTHTHTHTHTSNTSDKAVAPSFSSRFLPATNTSRANL